MYVENEPYNNKKEKNVNIITLSVSPIYLYRFACFIFILFFALFMHIPL